MNNESREMVEEAYNFGLKLRRHGLSRRQTMNRIKQHIRDPVLKNALLFNLRDDGRFDCNLRAIYENQEDIHGYEPGGTFSGPTLLINGEKSF